MAQRLHTNEILDRIISLIDANLSPAQPAGLGLKTIAKGDTYFYAGKDGLTVELPAVFIKPSPNTALSFAAIGKEYQVIYRHRLVYVRNFSTTEKVVEEQIKDTQRIVELLMDNLTLNELVLANAQLIHSLPSGIEWQPEEDQFVSSFNLWLLATAITFDVTVRTRR